MSSSTTASSRKGAERTAGRIEQLGRTAHLVQADIADGEQIRRLAEQAWARFGRIDAAVTTRPRRPANRPRGAS